MTDDERESSAKTQDQDVRLSDDLSCKVEIDGAELQLTADDSQLSDTLEEKILRPQVKLETESDDEVSDYEEAEDHPNPLADHGRHTNLSSKSSDFTGQKEPVEQGHQRACQASVDVIFQNAPGFMANATFSSFLGQLKPVDAKKLEDPKLLIQKTPIGRRSAVIPHNPEVQDKRGRPPKPKKP